MTGQTPARIWTGTLTGSSLTIVEADNVTQITLLVTNGTATITGNFPFPNVVGTPIAASPATLPNGTTFTYVSDGPQAPIDGLTIDASGGTCVLVFKM